MNSDIMLLNEIYNNSITAINAISILLIKLNNGKLFDCLFQKMTEYRNIANSAQDMMKELRSSPHRQNLTDRASLFFTVCLLGGNHTSEHRMAKILINGSTEGIYDIVGYINSCTDAGESSRKLAYKLIETEQKNICALNEYL
ncbi:MAG: hypothetical protein SOZ34_00770 [Clostridia bacterium]|nr:hypothetical protein [Clostridia bacterium]